jgi:hypothetical protein
MEVSDKLDAPVILSLEKKANTNWTRGWASPRDSFVFVAKKRILPCWEPNTSHLAHGLIFKLSAL